MFQQTLKNTLVLGLDDKTLERLATERPLEVTLDSENLTLVFSGAARIVQMLESSPDQKILGLTPRTLEALKKQGTMRFSLEHLNLSSANALLLFAQANEASIIKQLQASGLITPAPCPPVIKPPKTSDSPQPKSSPDPPKPFLRLVRRLIAHPHILWAGIIALCLGIGLVSEANQERERAQKRARARQIRAAARASHNARIDLLKKRGPAIMAPALSESPCPIEVPGPRTAARLKRTHGLMSRVYKNHAKRLGADLLFSYHYELMFADRQETPLGQHRSFFRTGSQRNYIATLIVDRLHAPTSTPSEHTMLGAVDAWMMLWSVQEKRFVCASPKFHAATITDGAPADATDQLLDFMRILTLRAGFAEGSRSLFALGPQARGT